MIKIIILLLVLLTLLAGIFCVFNISYNNSENATTVVIESQKYQGPVPQGFDLEHFRKTGETIEEKEK